MERRREDNIKMHLKGTLCQGDDSIQVESGCEYGSKVTASRKGWACPHQMSHYQRHKLLHLFTPFWANTIIQSTPPFHDPSNQLSL
jgi:hypothetical protein